MKLSADPQPWIRGFLLGTETLPAPEAWSTVGFGKMQLAFHSLTRLFVSKSSSHEVALIGIAVNPFANEHDGDMIALQLRESAERSIDEFHKQLSQLTGRHAVLLCLPDDTRVYGDAANLLAIFHTTNGEVAVGSHASLLGDQLDLPLSEQAVEFIGRPDVGKILYLPGNRTLYDNIRHLTANTYFSFAEKRPRRFWPVKDQTEPLLPASELASLLAKTLRLLSVDHRLLSSLTGGLDSRLTLAALGKTPALLYTYDSLEIGNKSMMADAEVARRIAIGEGFPHITLTAPHLHDGYDDLVQRHTEVGKLNTSGARRSTFAHLWTAHREVFESRLHLRSVCAEIARGFYRRTARSAGQPSISALADCYGFYVSDNFTEDAIAEFVDAAEFEEERFGEYNFYDLFYWETRMSVWQANVLLETDIAFETAVPLNNRKIIAGLLAHSLEDRLSGKIFLDAIAALAPHLLSDPVNAHNAYRGLLKKRLPGPVREKLRHLKQAYRVRKHEG